MTTSSPPLEQFRDVLSDLAEAVREQDAARCASWFTADARVVTATGGRAIGRDAIRTAHEAAFSASAAPVAARFEVLDAFFVSPDVAVVTAGAYAEAGDVPVDLDRPGSVVTHVLVRDGGTWSIAARQFTRVIG